MPKNNVFPYTNAPDHHIAHPIKALNLQQTVFFVITLNAEVQKS